jgi:TonB-dependent starch-binding outer membrane protein SusC
MKCKAFCKVPLCLELPTKIVNVMKLTTVFMLAVCLNVSAAGFAQKITLSIKNATLRQVFLEIKQQSGYQFLYNDQQVKKAGNISVQVHDASLEETLSQCLAGQPLTYTIVDKTIIIEPKKEALFNLPSLPPTVVHGKITDDKKGTVPGVTVRNKRSGQVVISNAQGMFSIAANVGDVLEFTSIGYKNFTFKVAAPDQEITIQLNADVTQLSNTVVIGYGSIARKDLTGSVSSVNVSEVRNVPFTSIDQALAGKAAGVQVVQADGSPGGVAKIRIRGGTSLLGGNDPLYIIDGVQVTVQNRYLENSAELVNPVERFGSGDPNSSVSGSFARGLNSLAGLNINDIESIDILKDASATAIYGSKAANGVIIITTKKGKTDQKPVLEANYYTGASSPVKEKLLNASQYKMIIQEAAKNLNDARAAAGQASDPDADNILHNPNYFGTANTDWLGLVLRTGISHNADISVRGGGNSSRYYTSLAYNKQDGDVKGTDFQRISGKISVDNEISKKLRVNTNLDYGFTSNNITNGIYAQALSAPPTVPAYNADGSVYQYSGSTIGNYDYTGYQNPMALLAGVNRGKTASLIGSIMGEYTIVPGLVFRSTGSVNYVAYHQLNYAPSTALIVSPDGVGSSNGGTGSQSQSEETNVFAENTLTWDKQFNENNRLNLLGGTSWQKYRYNSFSATAQGFPDDKFLNNLSSAATTIASTGTSGQNTLLSFYVRANYALKEKYLFTFTGRSDASSKIPANNRVGYFPSGGVAWRISEENFAKGLTWLNELKLRASTGYTGTQNISDYMFYTLYTPYAYAGTNALVPTQLGNNKIKWESTLQKDLGLDFAMLHSRIRGTVGYYEKKTSGVLLTAPVPASSAYTTVIANVAKIRNRGLEIDVRGDVIKGKSFQWTTALNVSGNRSLVLDVDHDFTNPSDDAETAQYDLGNSIVRKGQPLGLFYGRQFNGIIQTKDQLDAYRSSFPYAQYFAPYLGIGDPMYKIDSTTGNMGYYVIGHAEPKFYGGFTNTFTFKQFSLITLLTFSYGGQILYLPDVQSDYVVDMTNKNTSILNRWTPEHTHTDRPRLIYGYNGYTYTASNNVYSGSYIKLKSVTLSYQLPMAVANRLHIREAYAYASATNLFTITKYPGPDPEVSNNPYSMIDAASDAGTYPGTKMYNLGVRIGF